MTLEGLHDVIQVAMGWADCHLHHFQFGEVMYGVPTADDCEMHDGRKVKLPTALVDGERVFQFLYDYGEDGAASSCRKPSPRRSLVSSIRASLRAPGAVLPRTSAVRGVRRIPGGHRRLEARASYRTARMVRRRLRPAGVRYRCNQSPPRLACASKEHSPQDRQACHRLRLPGGPHRTRTDNRQ